MITKAGIAVPEDMAAALHSDAAALTAFDALRPDDQREFVNWLARPGAHSRLERLAELPARIANHKHRAAPAD